MRRFLRSAAAICVLTLVVSTGISANDGLSMAIVGDQVVATKAFVVRIRNNGSKRQTFCLSLCGTIIDTDTTRSAPAFAVQMRVGKKWNDRPWGCGAGNQFAPRVIQAGEIQDFRIKLAEPGTYRLRLAYKDVSADLVSSHCEAIEDTKSLKHATSEEFEVMAKPQ
jgi:hypothetical protein